VRTRDSNATYNPMGWAAVETLAGDAGLLGLWLDALDVPAKAFAEVVVREPSFIEGLAGLLDEGRIDAWRDWLRWQVIRSAAPYLHSEVVQANFDFYGKTLTGTPELRARWKRGVSVVEGALARPSGASTSNGTSAPPRRPRWTRWWPTWSRRTATASRTSNG
jgi:putative endopeptidase